MHKIYKKQVKKKTKQNKNMLCSRLLNKTKICFAADCLVNQLNAFII